MDSLGNKGAIESGESQWMTAGSGILHQEMPMASERMLGLQLWLNLPKEREDERACLPRHHAGYDSHRRVHCHWLFAYFPAATMA